MSFGSIPFGHGTFGGAFYTPASSPPIGGEPEVQIVIDPFTIEVAGVSMKGHQLINSLTMDFELGRQGTARFSLYNISISAEIGMPVRILYYSEVLFVGAVDRISMMSNNTQTFMQYDIECTDNSYILFRKKIDIAMGGVHASSIVNTVISMALNGDGVTLGVLDNNVIIPSATADGVSAFEFLNGLATSIGTVFSIDKERRLNFIAASPNPAPYVLDGDTVNACTLEIDRETYRNKQTTKVTGTSQTEGEQPLTVSLTRTNTEQVIDRIRVEGGSGSYNDIASVTHPSSNDNLTLIRLANAYNKISLALTGSIRQSLSVTTRQIGFEVGQLATVDLPHVGASGDWIIRRVSLREESGRFLISSLQLDKTSLMRRAQELWVEVVRKGTVTIFPPSNTYANSSVNTTPGIGSWQVPVGVTDIQITVYGGGGGGGGGANSTFIVGSGPLHKVANGAAGGGGGLVVKVLQVYPGTVFDFWVGAGGTAGAESYRANSSADAIGATGGNGIESYVAYSVGGVKVVRAYGGSGGLGGLANASRGLSISYPAGIGQGGLGGDAVTVGGGAGGGFGGVGSAANGSGGGNGAAGTNGRVVFEW